MSAPPSSKRSPPKRRLDSFPLPPLYYNKETIVDKTGRVHSVINMRGRSIGSTTPPCSPQSFNSVSPASQNHAIRGLSNTLLSAKELTPPSSPIKNRKMLYSTPSPACTVKTVPMTPETIASLSSSQLSPFAMSRTYAAVSTPTNVSSLTTLATPTKSYQHHSLSSSSPTRSEYSTTVGHSIHSPTQRSHRDVDPSDFGFCTPTNRSPSKKKIPFALGSLSPDDSSRKQKAKTELCMHYISNRVCPFGNNCTYAHGENELQKTKLIDLQRSGLIDDVESYRTKPCFTWVMVGSCPFGRRCASIHDPRVTGALSSWLPLTETQGNNISTDINVEGLHQKRLHTIMYGNPFGEQFSVAHDDWTDLYKLVTNTTSSNRRRRNTLSEIQKLSIALQMRGGNQWMYKYRPQHVIFQDLCMILEKCAFSFEDDAGEAVPISISKYRSGNPNHVMVREIAFGPDSDPTVRGVALWFNIPESEVVECTAQQAKRFRWRKTSKFEDSNMEHKPSVFDSRECFTMIRPHDRDAFDLATRLLRHRYESVKAAKLASLSDRFEALQKLNKDREEFQATFYNHRRHWVDWTYPINVGRQLFDDDTPVPPVDAEYNPIIDTESIDQQRLNCNAADYMVGSAIQGIWISFTKTMETIERGNFPAEHDPTDYSKKTDSGRQLLLLRERRLPIFQSLSRGFEMSRDRSKPHITSCTDCKIEASSLKTYHSRQSERCWKALLLKKSHSFGGVHPSNEWDDVVDHFQNYSRSKKVLSIIQK